MGWQGVLRHWTYVPVGESLSDREVRHGYWQFGRRSSPRAVTEPVHYRPSPGLFLDAIPLGTQDQVSDEVERQRVDQWCELLPTLTEVKQLWLYSFVPKRLLDAALQMPQLETLFVKWGNTENLDRLSELSNLRHLHLGGLSQVTNIDVLGTLAGLITLEIEDFKRVDDFAPLAALPQLEGLSLDGSIWNTQNIQTLAPIGELTSLRRLTLLNAQVQDKSLDPLLKLKHLEAFHSARWYPDSEFAKLRELPNLRQGNPYEKRRE